MGGWVCDTWRTPSRTLCDAGSCANWRQLGGAGGGVGGLGHGFKFVSAAGARGVVNLLTNAFKLSRIGGLLSDSITPGLTSLTSLTAIPLTNPDLLPNAANKPL